MRLAALYGLSYINTAITEETFDIKQVKSDFNKIMNINGFHRLSQFYNAIARQDILFDTKISAENQSESKNFSFFEKLNIQYRMGQNMFCYSMDGSDVYW